MAGLIGAPLTVARCLALQAAWSYERMQGVGMAWASEPALRRLFGHDPDRYRAALGRSASFFNANPFLAPTAVGAFLRAEADEMPPAQVERLRTALSGPLGALGDRLYWTGVVPALSGMAVCGVALGAGWWPVLALLLVHNSTRLWLGHWLLRLGWTHGPMVGVAMTASPLSGAATLAAIVATVAGTAAPLMVTGSALEDGSLADWGLVAAAVLVAVGFRWLRGRRASALKFTLAASVVAILWHLGRA